MDFYKYGGPGKKYEGNGRLPPMIKDVIVHYFYLLGLNPNEHARDIPDDYQDRWLDDLPFIPPPAHFSLPDWATPAQPGDDDDDDTEERSSYFSRSRPATPSLRPSTAGNAPSESPSSEPARTASMSSLRAARTPSPVPAARTQSPVPAARTPSPVPGSQSPVLRESRRPPPRVSPIRMKRAAQRSPPPPPSKRMRASPPSVRAPQASSTLREEYDLASDRPPIVLRLSKDRLAASKPPKKTPRLSMNSTIGSVCDYCHEKVTRMDIKSKNVLVKCSDHYVHKYCMKDCLEKH